MQKNITDEPTNFPYKFTEKNQNLFELNPKPECLASQSSSFYIKKTPKQASTFLNKSTASSDGLLTRVS